MKSGVVLRGSGGNGGWLSRQVERKGGTRGEKGGKGGRGGGGVMGLLGRKEGEEGLLMQLMTTRRGLQPLLCSVPLCTYTPSAKTVQQMQFKKYSALRQEGESKRNP